MTPRRGEGIRSASRESASAGCLRRGTSRGRCVVRLAAVAVAITVVALAAAGALAESAAAASDLYEEQLTLLSQEAEDRLATDFAAVLSLRNTPESTCLSVRVDHQSVFESQQDSGFVPASLVKVVTAAAALEVMRPDEAYRTEVFVHRDALKSVSDGVLTGDVYLIGGGDPVLSTRRYIDRFPEPVAHTDMTKLAERAYATLAGYDITRIEGRVVGDDSWFPDQERDYTRQTLGENSETIWKRSFVTLNTVGQLSGLLLNDGYSSYSGSTSSAGRRQNVRSVDPAKHAASIFDDLLEARGMVITKRPGSGMAPSHSERTSLGAIESPPLSEILVRMLSRSDNTTAEMLLKEIGRRTAGSARSSATASVQQILQEQLGPLAEGLVIADGSGLSSHNRLTCAALVELLSQAGPGSPLVMGLSVVGERGTLRWCRPAAAGQDERNAIRAKTGTLNQSTALAGTTVAANGEVLTFAMMANRPYIIGLGSCNSIRRGVLNAVARYTYRTLPPNGPVHAGDRGVLETLFDATGGDSWFNVWGWNTDLPLNRWHGVSTNESGRVTEIDLGGVFGNGMSGTIPEELGNLSGLRLLDLSGNALSGSPPLSISGLIELEVLQVSDTDVCWSSFLQSNAPQLQNMSDDRIPICTSFVDTFNTAYAEPIEDLTELGILEGSECSEAHICPYQPISRSTFAVWLTRILDDDEPLEVNASRFADVHAASWWAAHVERLAERNITAGCAVDPLRYCPDHSLTRWQAAVFLTRALEPLFEGLQQEIDAGAIAGFTRGCAVMPLRSCHNEVVTRGEAAAFLAEVDRILRELFTRHR